VLIADDQRVVREGLATILSSLAGVDVVATAADGAEAVALAGEHRPDVVLMDLRMPGLDGVAATAAIRERLPATKVVVLTTYADDDSVLAALGAGAIGYLTKDAGRDDIKRAIESAVSGHAVLDSAVQATLVRAAQSRRPAGVAARRAHRAGGGGARPDRGGMFEYGDRTAAVRLRGDGEDARQPHLRQDGKPGPRPGGRVRAPPRPGWLIRDPEVAA
jgi:DNA-binding NarL/FixJ family response regulator